MRPGSPGSAPSLRRTRDTQTRRYWRSSRYSGPHTLVRSSVCRTTLPAFAAGCCRSSHSVRESWTSSPFRVTMRRSRSISMSSKASTPDPGLAPEDRRRTARRQLVRMEGLGDVVVGPEIEALGLVGGRPLRGQQDHRHGTALAQLAHDLDAVEVGHHDVEEDDVGTDLLRLLERILTTARGDDTEPFLGERDRDELGDSRLI